MAATANIKTADRSSIEIKDLLRKLHPDNSNHKDRIRRLHKFRNYVQAGPNGLTPEFYDDDIPLLYLGAETPAKYIDQDEGAVPRSYFGLLQSAGLKGDAGNLKRSARIAANLLAWLLLDWKEYNQSSDLNSFARAFLSLPVPFYSLMEFNLHIIGDDRGGAKEDACRIIVLILTKHLDSNGERNQPVLLEEVVKNPQAQQAFDVWSAHANLSLQTQEQIKTNSNARQAEIALLQRQENIIRQDNVVEDFDDSEVEDEEIVEDVVVEAESDHSEIDELDVMAAIRKRQKKIRKELAKETIVSSAKTWKDCQLAREQELRDKDIDTKRQNQDEAQEFAEREHEKNKVLSRDPLGINDEDILNIGIAEQMELVLKEINEEIQKNEMLGADEFLQKAIMQKEAVEQLIEKLGGLENLESSSKASILPTDPKFHPILFLTLLHRKTSHKDLVDSLNVVASKTDNQAEQLQNLVRDNFPLYVKCAEGFEQFRTTSEAQVEYGINERIEKLEAIAESSTYQAKKSFKPLLDNTSQVRKVQSSLSVLQRVGPILQVPALMRQHIENRRYSQALKTYRRSLVIDNCNIEILNYVKLQAEKCVEEARRDLEQRLKEKSDLDELLDSIRDLNELLELDVPMDESKQTVGDVTVQMRDHPPSLACLLMQAAHFAELTKTTISKAEQTTLRIFESMDKGNQWKYDILDARVLSTIQAVDSARIWLPRLVRIGQAAREDEKRRAAKIGRNIKQNVLSAFEVFVVNVAPTLSKLVQHASFCSLGSNTRTGAKYVEMTFGNNADDKLRTLLRSPLPPSQSTKVGKELASLVELIQESSESVDGLRPENAFQMSPLEESKSLGESALITIEKRRCIYAFDVCSRACSNRASGSGKFDADALLNCLQTLAEQLSRPEECSNEVEKGCELVVRRCCEGLASYVRDRGDEARLNAVAECADVLSERIDEVIREASCLTPKANAVKEIVAEDIMGLESAMFDEYLESIRLHVANSVRVGWLDKDSEAEKDAAPSFPTYLSASLLAIVRCRAQVQLALGDRVRKAENISYQHLSMSTVSDSVVEGICNEVMKRKLNLKVRQADRLANELEFLNNSLKKFLGEKTLVLLDSTLHMVSSKAGRGRDYQGDGPDGLAALEELERLGRVYVLCLGD